MKNIWSNLFSGYDFELLLSYLIYHLILLVFLAITITVLMFLAKKIITRFITRALKRTKHNWIKYVHRHKVINKLNHLVPAIVIYSTSTLFVYEKIAFSIFLSNSIKKFASLYALIVIIFVINALLSVFQDIYKNFTIAKKRPIKSYIQLLKIILVLIGFILVISSFMERSPFAILTGIGAMTAIIMLIFKDSILGFVASLQVSFNDMFRIGDWIEIPSYGANGDIVDITLNSVKVQNFDKTIVTLPTYGLLSSGVKNWRGIQEAGGRRIKRSIYLDIRDIKFCTENQLNKFKENSLLADFIKKYLNRHKGDFSDLTNIRLFREYLLAYLKNHPKLNKKYILLVRQLQPTEKGLPLEIYMFVNNTDWTKYEDVQAKIFDHILAIISEFNLTILQNINNKDILVKYQ